MADEKKTKWKLDLDIQDALKQATEFKSKIGDIGDSENLAGLTEQLLSVGKLVGVAGAAFFALKTTMDQVFEGEQIKAVNQQFTLLTKNAGIMGETLKQSLVKVADGLIDDTDLIKAANGAIVEMGDTAKELPGILDLAKKSTAVFGGSVLQNFEALSSAIARGNTRALKQLGIVIDAEAAQKKYAREIGVTVGALSEAEKKQALLNAVIEKGNSAFAGVDPNLKEATTAWTKFKVAMQDIGDAVALTFEKIFGSAVKNAADGLSSLARDLKTVLVGNFGEGTDKAEANIKRLESSLKLYETELARMSNTAPTLWDRMFGGSGDAVVETPAIKAMKERIEKTKAEIEGLKSTVSEAAPVGGAEAAPEVKVDKEAQALRLQEAARFERELNQMRAQRIKSEQEAADSILEADRLHAEEKAQILEESAQRAREIEAQYEMGKIATEQQRDQMILEINQSRYAKLKSLDDQLLAARTKALDNYAKRAKSSLDGIAKSFKANSQKQALELKNFGKLGQNVWDSFENRSVDALESLGAGTKSATDAMTGFFYGMLGDWAASHGKVMMLAGIWPPNPPAIAGGAALIALGGFLKSRAGGSSGGGANLGEGGGGMSTGASQALQTRQERISAEMGVAEENEDFDKIRALRQEQMAADREELEQKKADVRASRDLNTEQREQMLEDLDRTFAAEQQRRAEEDQKKEQEAMERSLREQERLAGRPDLASYENNRRGLNLQIMGNYFDTEQTRTRLTEMLREAGDISDFRVTQIGESNT